jgi:hypothetical protein
MRGKMLATGDKEASGANSFGFAAKLISKRFINEPLMTKATHTDKARKMGLLRTRRSGFIALF